jgi:hypothetical protein
LISNHVYKEAALLQIEEARAFDSCSLST